MAAATRRANALERAVVDLAEAVVLAPRVGEAFDAVVVDRGPTAAATVQLRRPGGAGPVRRAPTCRSGERVQVRLVTADPVRARCGFARV